MRRNFLLICVGLVFAFPANSIFGQSPAAEKQSDTTAAVETKDTVDLVALEQDGSLKGRVFVEGDAKVDLKNTKLTLSHDGVVVATISADEEGVFSVASLEPGVYNMFAATEGFVGGKTIQVMPYGGEGCVDCNVGLSTDASVASYDAYAGAPVQAFSSAPCSSCGGGGGGGIGGRRRILRFAALGIGIAAIAGAFDGKDDGGGPVSPDN